MPISHRCLKMYFDEYIVKYCCEKSPAFQEMFSNTICAYFDPGKKFRCIFKFFFQNNVTQVKIDAPLAWQISQLRRVHWGTFKHLACLFIIKKEVYDKRMSCVNGHNWTLKRKYFYDIRFPVTDCNQSSFELVPFWGKRQHLAFMRPKTEPIN